MSFFDDYDSFGSYGGYRSRYSDYSFGAGEGDCYEEDITFVRPDGSTESKSISWCKDNDFFQVGEDLWSGPWYYRHHPEEHPDRKFPHKCSVSGCKVKFKTESELDQHLRLTSGKAHDEHRKANDIAFGPTKEEQEIAKLQREITRSTMFQEEYYDLLDQLNDVVAFPDDFSPGEEAHIRKRIAEIKAWQNGGEISTRKKKKKNNGEEISTRKKKKKKNTAKAKQAPKKPKIDAFATLMKSGGVAKKTPKSKSKSQTGNVVTPPSQNDGPPVVQCVYARYAKDQDSYGDGGMYVCGFDFHYSDGSTKKFGRTVGAKKSDAMHLEDKEYITSIDAQKGDKNSSVSFYTSSWTGRMVCFDADKSSWEDPWEDVGHQYHRGTFNAKNGEMISGLKISKGEITSVTKEEVPASGNRNWEDNWP